MEQIPKQAFAVQAVQQVLINSTEERKKRRSLSIAPLLVVRLKRNRS